MSHITIANQGLAAAEARNWDEAITKLSKALDSSPNPLWLIARSKALISTSRYEEALNDADMAWHSAFERNKRAQMIEAQYRRAVAYFRLKQYANADACCIYTMRLVKGASATSKEDPASEFAGEDGFWRPTQQDAIDEARNDSLNNGGVQQAMSSTAPANVKEWRTASSLRAQILGSMKSIPEDDPSRKWTTSFKPPRNGVQQLGGGAREETKTEAKPAPTATQPKSSAAPPAAPVIPADTPLRIQDFQSQTNMAVSIFSKGNDKNVIQVEFFPSSVQIKNIIYPNGDKRDYTLDLWGQIDVTKSIYSVTPNKVELNLAKVNPGKWKLLKSEKVKTDEERAAEVEEKKALEQMKQARIEAEKAAAEAKPPPSAPSYPTSSRNGPVNWDKVADEANEVNDEGDVNGFFKNLFKNASPDQQRAMMKSFTESNGTTLSTDWNDVGSRTVESKPPDGMEAKKWDS